MEPQPPHMNINITHVESLPIKIDVRALNAVFLPFNGNFHPFFNPFNERRCLRDTPASLCGSDAQSWIHICALMAINWENACWADPGTRAIHLTSEVQRLLA